MLWRQIMAIFVGLSAGFVLLVLTFVMLTVMRLNQKLVEALCQVGSLGHETIESLLKRLDKLQSLILSRNEREATLIAGESYVQPPLPFVDFAHETDYEDYNLQPDGSNIVVDLAEDNVLLGLETPTLFDFQGPVGTP
jgi:hypothetical protein